MGPPQLRGGEGQAARGPTRTSDPPASIAKSLPDCMAGRLMALLATA